MNSSASSGADSLARGHEIAARVEAFVRSTVVAFERDKRCGAHGPAETLVQELRELARGAGVLTPHLLPDGSHGWLADSDLRPGASLLSAGR